MRELPKNFDVAFFAWNPYPILTYVNFDDTHFAPVIHLKLDDYGRHRFTGLVRLGRMHNRGIYFYKCPVLPEEP